LAGPAMLPGLPVTEPAMTHFSFLLRISVLLFFLASAAHGAPLQCARQDCPAFGGHDALLHLVQQCQREQVQGGLQCPCVSLANDKGNDKGYVLTKDCKGVAQFLLMPTATITGIEDPQLQRAGVPNYFALAWQNRFLVVQALGRPLTDDQLSLALNPQTRRSQNQLHIHIDCIAGEVRQVLKASASSIGSHWQTLPVPLGGHSYRSLRIMGDKLAANPLDALLADLREQGRVQDIGQHGLFLTSMNFADGPGFVLLDGEDVAAEELQDHTCPDAGRP